MKLILSAFFFVFIFGCSSKNGDSTNGDSAKIVVDPTSDSKSDSPKAPVINSEAQPQLETKTQTEKPNTGITSGPTKDVAVENKVPAPGKVNPTTEVSSPTKMQEPQRGSEIQDGKVVPVTTISVPSLSFENSTGVIGRIGKALLIKPTTFNASGLAILKCNSVPALPKGLKVNQKNCEISGTPTELRQLSTYTIMAINKAGVGKAEVKLSVESFCPENYAKVSFNQSVGTLRDFCVAKFEMKKVGGKAVSQAVGVPWANINQKDAKAACVALGAGFDLISNSEWMTIAREIEKTATNWSGGVVGKGKLNRGHSDNGPTGALAVADINNPYSGTGNNSSQTPGSGWEQKRTHTLSNGEVIWDLAGNVMEWLDWTLGGGLSNGPTNCPAAGAEFPAASCASLSANQFMPANPANVNASDYTSSFGLGRLYGGTGGAALRGGDWGNGLDAGVFTLGLGNHYNYTSASFGFRCIYRP